MAVWEETTVPRTLLMLLAVLLVARTVEAQVPISTCGAVVPAKQVGTLQNDLDCGDIGGFCPVCTAKGCTVGDACQVPADCTTSQFCHPLPGVLLGKGARLDMNGHSIRAPGRAGVQCGPFDDAKGCVVFSSIDHGEIKDSDVGIAGGLSLVVSDVEVQNCRAGIQTIGKLRATNVSSSGNNNFGFWGKDIIARNVSADDNLGFGFVAGTEKLGKPGGMRGRIRGSDVTATGNGQAGVLSADPFTLVDLVATGNGFALGGPQSGGIVGLKGGTLADSTVTGNVNGPAHDPLDIFTGRPPVLRDTTCGTSGQYPDPTVGWGVCSND